MKDAHKTAPSYRDGTDQGGMCEGVGLPTGWSRRHSGMGTGRGFSETHRRLALTLEAFREVTGNDFFHND